MSQSGGRADVGDWNSDGRRKYPQSGLLLSSADRGWTTLSAELRTHPSGQIISTEQQNVEIVITLAGTAEPVISVGAGRQQETRPITGTIWIVPPGVVPEECIVTAPIPRTLHLYLPVSQFDLLTDQYNLEGSVVRAARSIGGASDGLIRQVADSVLSELSQETATSRMFAETSSLMLAARVIQGLVDRSLGDRGGGAHRLDPPRTRRVLDYIEHHLEDDFTVGDLAREVSLSPFHFARMFAAAVGAPPHRYVSGRRLEEAIRMLAGGKLSLSEVAFRSGFSSQASFTRAFRRATNMTPGEYRRKGR